MYRFFFLFLAITLAGCNNEKADKSPVDDAALPSKEAELQAAIKAHPDSMLLKEKLIQYYRENGNYDNALLEVNNAIRTDSNLVRLWDMKAILHAEDEDTSNAIRAFEKAMEISPTQEDIISLATLYAETKNPAALELSDELLNNKTGVEKEALFIKGLYYSSVNEKKKAISFFDKCLTLNYTFMYAYREKAIALYDMGKYENALAVLDKAITLQNNFEEAYYYSGRCLEQLNRKEEAIEAYQNAITLAPDYVEAKDALGKLGVK